MFWASVVVGSGPDQLNAVDPAAAVATIHIDLPRCKGAHSPHLHPDGQSAFVACESDSVLARVELTDAHAVVTAKTGAGPDVLSVDPGLVWRYVAHQSGDLTVFDINPPALVQIDNVPPRVHDQGRLSRRLRMHGQGARDVLWRGGGEANARRKAPSRRPDAPEADSPRRSLYLAELVHHVRSGRGRGNGCDHGEVL